VGGACDDLQARLTRSLRIVFRLSSMTAVSRAPTIRRVGWTTERRYSPARSGRPPRETTAATGPGRCAAATSAASEQRPAAGWASLTDIQQATARLVAEGLSNQRIADQLFISTHTVAFHPRQVFRKLDIRSRVDLAPIALEHARPEAAQTP
jgi:DNA-binding CsgD family transcriptional regulator